MNAGPGLVVLLAVVLTDCVFLTESFLLGSTCLNRCHDGFSNRDDYACQCNPTCVNYGDCCDDYQTLCVGSSSSCQGRCNDNVNTHHSCQCNSHCTRYNDCCHDYTHLCLDPTPSSSSCKTLSQLGQALWDNDINRLSPADISTNFQSQISDGTSTDRAASKLFTNVNESKLSSPTFAAFLSLLDNFYPSATSSEHTTSHEAHEVDTFLASVINTKVMAVLLDFLKCQGLASSQSDLRATLKKIWFDYYRRSSRHAYSSTSGFEHVLVGEFKDSTTVSGFHSWLSFYVKEKAGHVNYLGYVSRSSPDIVGAAFTWDGHLKTKGTFLVGVSPEFDMAIYTVCYLLHKDSTCRLTLQGHAVSIKTYDSTGHIATAYVM